MAEMFIVKGAAVTLPVNRFALIDDTDMKTIEASVVYNAAGMALKWNFTTAAGVTTQTAVTPSNSGNYLWTNSGNGFYRIQMPASGGASISNNADGFGWFSGVATGVMPWISWLYQFGAADGNTLLSNPTTGLVEIYNLANNLDADATLADVTKYDIVDKLLGRNQAGGANGGRTVSRALKRIANRAVLGGAAGDTTRTMTIYENDGTTVAFTATVTFDSGGNVVGFAPTS